MGVGQIAVQWFKSYLSGREQLVSIADKRSDFRTVSCGVPQGSILGPLLFLIYVNDMKAAVKCKLLLYADDSALLVSGKDVSEVERTLSMELGAVTVSVNGCVKTDSRFIWERLNLSFLDLRNV